MSTHIAIAVVMIALGAVAKYADLLNEHGVVERFPGARFLSGLVWGALGDVLIVISPLGGLTYVAHVLYWFQRVKLEYPNHATAGVMMLLGGFWFQGDFLFRYRVDLLAVFVAYLVTGLVQTYYKSSRPETRWFWRLRLRIYLIPAAYSLYSWNVEPLLATCCGMIGCEWVTARYRENDRDLRQSQNTVAGASYAGHSSNAPRCL